jgi:hypothetical protein
MKHLYTKGTLHWLPSWEAVIQNLDLCIKTKRVRDIGRGGYVAQAVLHDKYKQANILAKELGDKVELHTYISLSTDSKTSGKHKDLEDVWCLQAQGRTLFKVWEEEQEFSYILDAGDMLYIPSMITHEATPLTPRVLLSYGEEV